MAWDMVLQRLKDEKNYPVVILAMLTLIGLISKLLFTLRLGLNSDSVVPGLQAIEIFRHQNTLLSGFNYSQNYPAIFTDLVPFHMVPQLLSGYDPLVLKLTSFVIFLLILAVYTALVYKVTKDRIKAMLFLALAANMTPGSFLFYVEPVAHAATIMFAGIFLYILLDHEKLRAYQAALLVIAAFILVFSDNMALAIVVLPFVVLVCYKALRKHDIKNYKAILPAICILFAGLAAYAVKTAMPSMVYRDIDLVTSYTALQDLAPSLIDKFQTYISATATVTSDGLSSLLEGHIGIGEIVSLILVSLFLYSLWNILKRRGSYSSRESGLLLWMLTASALLLAGSILSALDSPRYFLFTALSVLLVIALGYDRSKLYLALAAIVIVSGIVGCVIIAASPGPQPNSQEMGIIGFLEENNLTTGYGGYWDANIITYLSDEQIQLRAINYKNGHMVPYDLLSDSRWYDSKPTKFFILYHEGHDDGKVGAVTSTNPWNKQLNYGEYYVFVYDMDHSPMIFG